MQARRLAKRSSMGSRRLSAGPAAAQTDGARPPKPESAWRPPRREGSAAAVEEEDEDEDVVVEVFLLVTSDNTLLMLEKEETNTLSVTVTLEIQKQ